MTKKNKTIRELAEEHWEYSRRLIILLSNAKTPEENIRIMRMIAVCHYLYVEAFVHGYKHRTK